MLKDSLRLFFCVWPAEEHQNTLGAMADELAMNAGGRPVWHENVHLTLLFLGLQPRELLPKIAEAAARIKTPGFDLVCDKLSFRAQQNLIWTGVSNVPKDLVLLHDVLGQEMTASGIHFDKKRFRPHITLVRDARLMPDNVLFQPCGWSITHFALVASNLSNAGPRYEVLQEWKLGEPRPPVSADEVVKLPAETLI